MSGLPIQNEIRRLRFEHGDMTQAHLGELAKVTRQTIAAIEQGKYLPTLEVGFRIARAFGVSIEQVFRWAEVSQD